MVLVENTPPIYEKIFWAAGGGDVSPTLARVYVHSCPSEQRYRIDPTKAR
jgi:hypothetical protein